MRWIWDVGWVWTKEINREVAKIYYEGHTLGLDLAVPLYQRPVANISTKASASNMGLCTIVRWYAPRLAASLLKQMVKGTTMWKLEVLQKPNQKEPMKCQALKNKKFK